MREYTRYWAWYEREGAATTFRNDKDEDIPTDSAVTFVTAKTVESGADNIAALIAADWPMRRAWQMLRHEEDSRKDNNPYAVASRIPHAGFRYQFQFWMERLGGLDYELQRLAARRLEDLPANSPKWQEVDNFLSRCGPTPACDIMAVQVLRDDAESVGWVVVRNLDQRLPGKFTRPLDLAEAQALKNVPADLTYQRQLLTWFRFLEILNYDQYLNALHTFSNCEEYDPIWRNFQDLWTARLRRTDGSPEPNILQAYLAIAMDLLPITETERRKVESLLGIPMNATRRRK